MKQKARVQPLSREEFEALPIVEQRKVLARDVVSAIRGRKMKGSRTLNLFSLSHKHFSASASGECLEPDEAVAQASKCYVCGIGAPMVAAARRVDSLNEYFPYGANSLGGRADFAVAYLRRWFPQETLHLVEAAYENEAMPGREPPPTFDKALAAFRSAHGYGTLRLRAIWQQVADDPEGLFRLEEA